MITTRSTHAALYLVLLKPNTSPQYLIYRTASDSLVWDIPMFQRDAAMSLTDNVKSILQEILQISTHETEIPLKYLHRFPFNVEYPDQIADQGYVEAVFVGLTDQAQLQSSISLCYPMHIWANTIDCVAKLRHHAFVEGILMADHHIRQSGNFW